MTNQLALAKVAEIGVGLDNFSHELRVFDVSLQASERVLADARLKVSALEDRRREIAADVQVVREMLIGGSLQ